MWDQWALIWVNPLVLTNLTWAQQFNGSKPTHQCPSQPPSQVFTFSYCVASEALLYPFHERPVNETIFNAFRRSYFNVFGDLDIVGLSDRLVEGNLRYLMDSFSCTGKLSYNWYQRLMMILEKEWPLVILFLRLLLNVIIIDQLLSDR